MQESASVRLKVNDEKPKENKRVLVIEDNAGFRLIYRELLTQKGYEVLEAEDGDKGIETAKCEKPDLILLDLLLPRVHGFEVLKQVRSDPVTQSIPVIVFSVVNEKVNIDEAFRLGANEFIYKGPDIPAELFTKLAAYLDSKPPLEIAGL